MTHVYLVADTRERYVHGLIETIFGQAGETHTIAQINTGDYLICQRAPNEQPTILACIERKTLKDFGASFKDGRYGNRNKMLDLRDRTGCQLYFFVEGPAFPKPTWKVARVPYASILAAMTNMMVRDGILIVLTENEMHTAQRLLDFVQALKKTDVPYRFPVAGEPQGGAPGGDPQDGEMVPREMMGVIEKSDAVLAVEIWSRLGGVSVVTAKVLTAAFSIADLVSGGVADGELAALRTPANRALPKPAMTSLRGLRAGNLKESAKILSGVPGISPAMAAQLLEGRTLKSLLEGAGLANLALRQKGRTVRLGAPRAERVDRLLRYIEARRGAPPDDDPAPAQREPPDEDPVAGLGEFIRLDMSPAAQAQRAERLRSLHCEEPVLDDDELDALLGD